VNPHTSHMHVHVQLTVKTVDFWLVANYINKALMLVHA